MFNHQQGFDHFEWHSLSDNTGTKLVVVPSRGGIISEFEVANQPVFYLDRDSLNDASKNVRGGNPILFPICGPLTDGHCQINGKSYAMKQHGFARNLPWTVTGVETGADRAEMKLRLESNATTHEQYPFDFRVDFSYQLTADSLKIAQRYHNLSDQKMPFYAGFHPYFAAPEKSAVEIKVAHYQLDDFIAKKTHEVGPVINFDGAPETNGAYCDLPVAPVRFSNFGQNRSITFEFSEPYHHIVIWALKDKPFICVEPWMGLNYSLNTGRSVVELAAGAELEAFVTVKIQ